MKAQELREAFIGFFVERSHNEIASASLLPDNDPSVLFTTAGMHPLVPYLLGERHPQGKRLVNVQKCVRTDDIDEVGDETHHTCFEMLGNWSLGDYFKKEAIGMSYEFLTGVLKIPHSRLAVTVFGGDGGIEKDDEAHGYWKEAGLEDGQVFFGSMEDNWWGPAGMTGPCGPDTEIFYDTGKESCGDECGPLCGCGRFVEIWNNVFMQYNKNTDGSFSALAQKNVDTGMGLERILAVMNQKHNNYETDLFEPIMQKIEILTDRSRSDKNIQEFRIIADHMRAAVFILGDPKKIQPSNTEQGYIIRRLLRRTIRYIRKMGVVENILTEIANEVIQTNSSIYPELSVNQSFITEQIDREFALFSNVIDTGIKKAGQFFNRLTDGGILDGELAFKLYDTFGFPIEFTEELAQERGMTVDVEGFKKRYAEHQQKSRTGAEGRFKGGLADNNDLTTRLHTATHLLNAALRQVLGDEVFQRGSNINSERLRFDFSFRRKLTEDELLRVGEIVNEAISKEIDVTCEEMTVEAAKAAGAIGVFTQKYGDTVKVYTIDAFSKEICGGPHVLNTRELGIFTIQKEESSSAGVRRIRASLEPHKSEGIL